MGLSMQSLNCSAAVVGVAVLIYLAYQVALFQRTSRWSGQEFWGSD